MKRAMKILGIIVLTVIVLTASLLLKLKKEANKPMVEDHYWEKVQTGSEIEAKYMGLGEYAVKSVKYDVTDERWSHVTIWYPAELESSAKAYPLVVMANGTGVQNDRYEPVFAHLSSWGFVVVGNDDLSSGLGDSTAKSLDFVLELNGNADSIFFQKIDTGSIGVAGHSQGGVAAIHALYAFENSVLYRAAYTASAATETMIQSWNLTDFAYDIAEVTVPILMVAGTGDVDSKTISPLADMKRSFDRLRVPAVMARRKNTDHGEMLYAANGYMVAWFRYTLMEDAYAGKAFIGDNAEILHNESWQDRQSKLFE